MFATRRSWTKPDTCVRPLEERDGEDGEVFAGYGGRETDDRAVRETGRFD